ncbi:MAG TPA: S9 family peptidase [Usitatibacteraceae bacterium]|nr:S9 family peptidase [Usitatibacteraceae bacterium]
MRRSVLLMAVLALASTSPLAQTPTSPTMPTPPIAAKKPQVFEKFGDKRVDDYFWLRDKKNPEVIDYLKAENAYRESMMASLKPFEEQLYKDMLSRIKETDENVPYRKGDYWYYSRTEMGKQYSIYCRKKGSLDAKEEIVLDLNEFGKDNKFVGLGAYNVSPDGKMLAYSTDFTGFRQYTLRVKNLETGKTLADTAERVTSVAWANDNQTLFYVTEDNTTKRSDRLFRLELGGKPEELYFEKDELYNIGVDATRSKGYIVLVSESAETNENWLLDANKPGGKFESYLPRKENTKYYVDHAGQEFFVVINDKGRNFRMVTAPAGKADKRKWKEVIAHRPDVKLDGVDVFKDFFVAVEKFKGLPQLRIFDMKTRKPHTMTFPEPAYDASPGQNAEFDTRLYRFDYSSLVTPNSVFDYDVTSRERTLKKQQPVLGGYDTKDYLSERVWAVAKDGTKVPISLVYKKALRKSGPQPTLLYGYGSYGISMPLAFRSNRLALLDRGMIFAIAHIRGGGEMGKKWHDDGKMMKKMNTFTDFIAAAEHLVAKKYTEPKLLAIQGGSAGGLLMGAVTNLRPDLFKAVVSQVPFVDVMNTMLDASLPLTVGEYLEWGNPNEEKAYKYMRSYSPYDNLEKRAYPAMLVETSLNDSQVMYWEPAKYVARLRTLKTDNNPLYLKTILEAGHGGASGRYDALKETAVTYAFVLSQMGITQ